MELPTCGAGAVSYLGEKDIKLQAKRGTDFSSCANKRCETESYTSVRANQKRLVTSYRWRRGGGGGGGMLRHTRGLNKGQIWMR